MKKMLRLISALLLCGTLCACNTESQNNEHASDPIESYDETSKIVIEDEKPGETAKSFDIQHKTYTYRDGNVVIMRFGNPTDTHYSVTVTANYLDESGNVLQTEMQNYKDIASKTETHFVWNPGIAFADFSYSVDAAEYTGVCKLSNIKQLVWDEDSKDAYLMVWPIHPSSVQLPGEETPSMYGLHGNIGYENQNEESLARKMTLVSFNQNGEILHIQHFGWKLMSKGVTYATAVIAYSDTEFTAKQSSWPEQFKDGIDVLLIATDVATEEEYREIIRN